MFHPCLDGVRTVLCVGAHSDDIEIGCGGTLLSLLAAQQQVRVYWVVLSAAGQRAAEAQASAEAFLQDALEREIIVKDFRDRYFPYDGEAIKEYFDELGGFVAPDLIFTHRREDMHQDHRLVAELTWNTFRNHLILEYEIPKYEGDLGAPNVFVPLDEKTSRRKIDLLMESFPSQSQRTWFSAETFRALLRLRGNECNSSTGFAEGLYCRKLSLSLNGICQPGC